MQLTDFNNELVEVHCVAGRGDCRCLQSDCEADLAIDHRWGRKSVGGDINVLVAAEGRKAWCCSSSECLEIPVEGWTDNDVMKMNAVPRAENRTHLLADTAAASMRSAIEMQLFICMSGSKFPCIQCVKITMLLQRAICR